MLLAVALLRSRCRFPRPEHLPASPTHSTSGRGRRCSLPHSPSSGPIHTSRNQRSPEARLTARIRSARRDASRDTLGASGTAMWRARTRGVERGRGATEAHTHSSDVVTRTTSGAARSARKFQAPPGGARVTTRPRAATADSSTSPSTVDPQTRRTFTSVRRKRATARCSRSKGIAMVSPSSAASGCPLGQAWRFSVPQPRPVRETSPDAEPKV